MNVDIKDFQYKILEIAFYFDEFCKKYDIEYYLMGGSALGAVRPVSYTHLTLPTNSLV